VRLIIDIDADGLREVTAESDGSPAQVHESVNRMAQQLTTICEIYGGEEVDTVLFADVAYLDSDEC
jgi:hypothetical protein